MQHTKLTNLALGALLLAGPGAQAADVRINGFMSIVGGATLSEGETPTGDATFEADLITEGFYDDEISFKPDSNYGVQISTNLGDNLSVTGQITGNGGEDFDAVISWAYISYDLNDTWNLQAGRQRAPLFFYSDFLDVAYAYHWIRPPQQIAGAFTDTFEGIKFNYANSTDNWDWNFSAYGGAGDEASAFGTFEIDVSMENLIGFVGKMSNDWLQLRASYAQLDILLGLPDNFEIGGIPIPVSTNGVDQGTSDNPLEYTFAGLAAHMTFGDVFVVAEYTYAEVEETFAADGGVVGFDDETGWYISSGIRLGSVTPHITYGNKVTATSVTGVTGDFDEEVDYLIVGARWDFHPSAAAKFEYTTQSDKSDDFIQTTLGRGEAFEVDVFNIGIDVIF